MTAQVLKAHLAKAAAGAAVVAVGFTVMAPAQAAHLPRFYSPSGGAPVFSSSMCAATSLTTDPAGDTVGQSGDCAQVGYVASGRDFRFAQAMITVPDHIGEVLASPTLYVALDASTGTAYDYARVGVEPCTSTGGSPTCPGDASDWQVFATVNEPDLGSPTTVTWPVSSAAEGSGILVNVFYNAAGSTDTFTATLPGGTLEQQSVAVTGPVYTRAEALTDWAPANVADSDIDGVTCGEALGGRMREGPPTAANPCRENQFFQGRFTTASGNQGTFLGPWTLSPVEATSNGYAPPGGTLLSSPSYLWNDGSSYQNSGGDAFGVWIYRERSVPV